MRNDLNFLNQLMVLKMENSEQAQQIVSNEFLHQLLLNKDKYKVD